MLEKDNILDILCKMDPIFMGIKILNIEEVIIYDSLNNRYEIKEEKNIEYTDFDGKSHVTKEIKSETQDFNIIKGVEVERVDTNEYKGFWFCKSWIIIYYIYHINQKNQRIMYNLIVIKQSNRDEDSSKIIKNKKEKRLNLIK